MPDLTIPTIIAILAPIVSVAISWGVLTQKVNTMKDSDEEYKKMMKENIDEIKKDIKNIKENHLAHVQSGMAQLSLDIAVIKTSCELKNCKKIS